MHGGKAKKWGVCARGGEAVGREGGEGVGACVWEVKGSCVCLCGREKWW